MARSSPSLDTTRQRGCCTGFRLPNIPDRPTPAEIGAAQSLLLGEMLGEFPFTGEAERAHALALLLLPFVRPMIAGPTPLHLIEKPAPGTGATLMVDAMSLVTTGVGASVMVEGRDEDEWRKRLTAKLRTIPTMLLIDNLRRRLDSSSVAAALTAPYWEDRILGKSEMTRFPIRCTWVATGNNPQVSNEVARRLVRIRLDPHVDQPWMREGFRHPELLSWVRENRARLVAACLTLGRAWIASGQPRHRKTIGSFEGWSQVIGGILEVAGVPGFLDNLREMYETADAEGAIWRVFIAQWWDRHGTAQVGTSDLHQLALACEPPLPLGSGNDRSQRTALGRGLVRMRDRVFDIGISRVRLENRGEKQGAQRWRLTLVETGA
jgi:putative DNA primase/helicase